MLISIPIMLCYIWYYENSTSHVDLQLKKKSVLYLGWTYGCENTSAGWKQHRVDEHECLSVCISSRGDLTFQMTWFCLAKSLARHSKSTVQSRYIWHGYCCQTLSIFKLIKELLCEQISVVCLEFSFTLSKGVTLGSKN